MEIEYIDRNITQKMLNSVLRPILTTCVEFLPEEGAQEYVLAFTMRSISSFMLYYHCHGSPQQHHIQPDAPVMDVPAVHLYALGVVDITSSAGLPHAGDAGEDRVVLLDIFPIPRNFLLDDGTGTDEAHLTFENIQELRQLIEAGLSKEGAALCDAGIVLQFEFSIPFFFRRRIGREEVV